MITRDMVIRDVIREHPETTSIFGRYRVDFCCGGHNSIEDTAKACGVTNIDELIYELNEAVRTH